MGIPTIQKYVPTSTGTTSTKNNMTVGNEIENTSSSGMTSTTGKKSFIGLINPDGKITTTKTISIRKLNIDDGTDTNKNITTFVVTPADPKINKLVQHGNNKKIENKEDRIFNDQEVERSKKDIKEKESSQLHDSDCVEFLDTLDFDYAAIDDEYINYLDETT